MTKSITHIKRTLLIVFTLLVTTSSFGYSRYWFQVNAKAAPTGTGKIYATDKYVPTEELKKSDYNASDVELWYAESRGKAATLRFHLYALPEEGYAFKSWTKGDEVVSLMKHCTPSERSTSKSSDEPSIFEYQANFVEKGSVAVYSNNESAGTIVIDKPDNQVGDVVTLTAYPNNFVGVFLGWIKGPVDSENTDLNSLDFISKEKAYTFTVTEENKGDYYAVFEMRNEGIYCMVSNYKTSHCMGIRGTNELTLSEQQRYFKNAVSLIPIDKAHSTPAAVVKVIGTYDGVGGLVNAEYISQGFSSKDIGDGDTDVIVPRYFRVEQHTTDTYLTYAEGLGMTGYWREIRDRSCDYYEGDEELLGKIYHPWTGNTNENINKEDQWCLLPLTEEKMDEYYFGAAPKSSVTQDGKYYTTMYTSFPYKCMDGVKAYTVDKYLKNAKVHLNEITSGMVPSYTAVILECNGTTAKENRLIPIFDEPEAITGTNYLKGELWLDDESGNPDNYRTRFDPNTMRVLSDDKAAFVKFNNKDTAHGDTILTYIANNTCYLELDKSKTPLYEYTFTTEDDPDASLLGDVDNNGVVNITDVMLTTNYVIGKTPSVFIFENADINKDTTITITDVMFIVNIILGK